VLHIRVVCPPTLTPTVLDILRGQPGVTNVARHTAVVVEPAGDIVTADVAREATSQLLDSLRTAGAEERGSIVLLELDTALGRSVESALLASPRVEDDAIIHQRHHRSRCGRYRHRARHGSHP